MSVYRAVRQPKVLAVAAATTPRPPGNVPYLIDNIWEWLRPSNLPSRRRSAYASPRPELAAQSANCGMEHVYEVHFSPEVVACQLVNGDRPEDARYHPDIVKLRTLILRECLGETWLELDAESRWPEAILFLPCASKSDIDVAMRKSARLDSQAIRDASTFWHDVKQFTSEQEVPHGRGEIFFDGSYQLARLQ